MELTYLSVALALGWSVSMAWSIWVIRDRDSRLTAQISLLDQERSSAAQREYVLRTDYEAKETVLLNRIMAKDPSEFLTLQAGSAVKEWPKRRQLLTDREEAIWDRARQGAS